MHHVELELQDEDIYHCCLILLYCLYLDYVSSIYFL